MRASQIFFAVLVLSGIGLLVWAFPALGRASVVIEWTTASELDTVGFYVYRSDRPDGELVRVTPNLIPASPDPLTGGAYQFVDTDVRPGGTYYYWLEDIETSGTTTRHGPEAVQAQRDGVLGAGAAMLLLIGGLLGFLTESKRQSPSAEK